MGEPQQPGLKYITFSINDTFLASLSSISRYSYYIVINSSGFEIHGGDTETGLVASWTFSETGTFWG